MTWRPVKVAINSPYIFPPSNPESALLGEHGGIAPTFLSSHLVFAFHSPHLFNLRSKVDFPFRTRYIGVTQERRWSNE